MVRVASARINEKGTITGGQPGDQTGKEVSIQNWYLHKKGWIVIRAKDDNIREAIAHNMESIVNNDNIGYCQTHRSSLTTASKQYGYDASKVTQKVEVDCSEAVRNCLLYAGIPIQSFSTATEATAIMHTGEFYKITDTQITNYPDYLIRGDNLVTRTKGHTVVVLDNGQHIFKTYTVKPGDNLTKIANMFNTTIDKILADNRSKYPGITRNYILSGWILIIK